MLSSDLFDSYHFFSFGKIPNGPTLTSLIEHVSVTKRSQNEYQAMRLEVTNTDTIFESLLLSCLELLT